ncbi:hypothetical protein ABW21_db0207004 [Orbilia brochopaga]|nr:hypothetical protein ABW21_db0207004 [Drechslerella brochopaga]
MASNRSDFRIGDKKAPAPGGAFTLPDGLGASRYAVSAPKNPFYKGPMDPRHRDPTAVVLESSTGSLAADPVAGTVKSWNHIEDTGSKIIFHLDEINCLVNGVVKPKDGAFQSKEGTVVQATANLSISIDKVLLFGQGLELATDEKGAVFQDGSAVKFSMEGTGQKGRAPALGVNIIKAENVKPENLKPENVKPLGPVTPTHPVAPVAFLPEKKHEEPLRQQMVRSSLGFPLFGRQKTQTEFASPASAAAVQDFPPLKIATRCVLITGLPVGFKATSILELIKPTRNTLVIEVQLTQSNSALFHFFTPDGAQDFISQFPGGYIDFKFVDPDLGPMEHRAKAQLWGDFVAIKNPDVVVQATRFLGVSGRNPTTIKEATSGDVWSLGNYREHLGAMVYDAKVRRDIKGVS